MENIWKFVTFDWPDGSWKSTVTKLLAEKHNAIYYRTPGGVTMEEREKYDLPGVTPQERLQFYTNLLARDAHRIQDILQGGSSVFCDRFMLSTMVHHKVLDRDIDVSWAQQILNKTKPDCSIVIYGNIDSLMERVMARETQTRFELDRDLVERTQKDFLSYPDIHTFDNTGCTIEETMNRITNRLKTLCIL